MCSADLAALSKEQKVPAALGVELEELEDLLPQVEGLDVQAELDLRPMLCQGLVDDLQVMVLEVLEGRLLQELQPT